MWDNISFGKPTLLNMSRSAATVSASILARTTVSVYLVVESATVTIYFFLLFGQLREWTTNVHGNRMESSYRQWLQWGFADTCKLFLLLAQVTGLTEFLNLWIYTSQVIFYEAFQTSSLLLHVQQMDWHGLNAAYAFGALGVICRIPQVPCLTSWGFPVCLTHTSSIKTSPL